METPYHISVLPQPLDKEAGRTNVAPVFGLRGSRKRKRHEVAVAVDGEGIQTYNVQTQALVASYALPPQTYFCCKPCAIFCRATASTPAQRRTYTVTRTGASDAKRKVVCFTENVRSKKGGDEGYATPKKLECTVADGEIDGVHTAATIAEETPSLVICYKDGRIVTMTGELTISREDRRSFAGKAKRDEVEHSTVVDTESARKGLLKGREDVLAALDQSNFHGSMLCQIVRSRSARRLDICQLRSQQLQTVQSRVQPLMSLDLPISGDFVTSPGQHEVHAASSRLYSLVKGELAIFDIGSTIPKILTGLGSEASPITSFARLSTSSLLATSGDIASVYEVTYGAIQATGSLRNYASTAGPSKKRKRDDSELDEQGSPVAVSLLADFGMLVFLSDDQLMAVQLGEELLSQTRSNRHSARLADVIGQGTEKPVHGTGEGETKDKWTTRVDDLIESNDVEGLEALVANDDALGRQRKPENFRRKGPSDPDDKKGDMAAYEDLWPLPERFDATGLDQRRIMYVLGKVFGYTLDGSEIEVRIASRKLLEWLALTGHLNIATLNKALGQEDAGAQGERVRPGDIMKAISEVDENFQLMHSLMSLPIQWALAEVMQALCLLIQSFNPTPDGMERALQLLLPPEAEEEEHLPNGDVPTTNGDTQMTNGDTAMVNGDAGSNFESESRMAENELEHVQRILASGLEVRSETLRVIFERLHAFPSRDLTIMMKAMLTQKELIFLIHMLRIELADGGWTSRYTGVEAADDNYDGNADPMLSSMVDVIPSDGEPGPNNQAIRTIGDLLNCGVDALGTSGWLVGLSGDSSGTEELLDSLRAEVSAGLEGCYEANTLGTFLADLERFVTSSKRKLKHQDGREQTVDPILPVCGKATPTTLKSKDSNAKKGKHIVGIEKSKKVGKYSLDKIRF